jgi:hypothetical protein
MKTYTGYISAMAILLMTARNDCHAFAPIRVSSLFHVSTGWTQTPSSVGPLLAGFGKSSEKNKKKAASSSTAALKPKSQWDRFKDFKQSTAIRVAVRKINGAWMEVGRIKAKEDTLDAQIAAVTLQRALIAEHAKRLYPLQILNKDKIEWGYAASTSSSEDDEFIAINVKQVKFDGFDPKSVGFEGTPDPVTGYYCHYENGIMGAKAVNVDKSTNTEKGEPNSKGARAM